MNQNSIMVLKPYKREGMWVFDDEKTGLVREPFVAGVPEILESLLEQQGIPLRFGEFAGRQALPLRRVGTERGAGHDRLHCACGQDSPLPLGERGRG